MNAVNRMTTEILKFIAQIYSTKIGYKSVLLYLTKLLIFIAFSKRYGKSWFIIFMLFAG